MPAMDYLDAGHQLRQPKAGSRPHRPCLRPQRLRAEIHPRRKRAERVLVASATLGLHWQLFGALYVEECEELQGYLAVLEKVKEKD